MSEWIQRGKAIRTTVGDYVMSTALNPDEGNYTTYIYNYDEDIEEFNGICAGVYDSWEQALEGHAIVVQEFRSGC